MENVIEARGLTKVYGARRAVDNIDFTVRRGEAFGFLGPNGAGKSTTMRMIACRSPLTDGTLTVENLDTRCDARQIRALLGVVPQENNLDPDISVRQNLIVYARYFRMDKTLAAARADELLDFFGLASRKEDRPEELSGGMQRRLMIARALLHDPRVLILDEPTTGLDPQVRQEIWQRLEELRAAQDLTVTLSTHYMDEAERLCERILIIDEGVILASGSPAELIKQNFAAYALEVRDYQNECDALIAGSNLKAVERAGAHIFFADSPDAFATLMQGCRTKRMLLRPANLEDVFLKLVGTASEE